MSSEVSEVNDLLTALHEKADSPKLLISGNGNLDTQNFQHMLYGLQNCKIQPEHWKSLIAGYFLVLAQHISRIRSPLDANSDTSMLRNLHSLLQTVSILEGSELLLRRALQDMGFSTSLHQVC